MNLEDTTIEDTTIEDTINTIIEDTINTIIEDTTNTLFDFVNDNTKLLLLIKANENLKLKNNKIIFVYSAPKVGSTSIVSSLRIFALKMYDIIHIHDEEMLRVLGNINGITINEIILYNKYLGKEVFVIDIYRSPIERKISTFFEKIGSYHFNNYDHIVNNYNVTRVINRFNKIFPHIGLGDHFIDKYNICVPEQFDYLNKYLLVCQNGITYIKLRLKDASSWGQILSTIFKTKICIVKDYESTNKPIKNLYNIFKSVYKIPKNLLEDLLNCKYLNYYYSPEEKSQYYNDWNTNSGESIDPYTDEQYRVYNEITLENSHLDCVQLEHYMDEGCSCMACNIKRRAVSIKIMNGVSVTDRITHIEANKEYTTQKAVHLIKVNKMIQQQQQNNKTVQRQVKGKDFHKEMTNIVKRKQYV
jgi:hypothetical protein